MSTDEIPVVEGAYDAACAILAKYVDGYGEVRGLTAYQAGIRAVDAAAPLIAAEAEKRGAVKALARVSEEIDEDKRYPGFDLVMWLTGLQNGIESGEVTI